MPFEHQTEIIMVDDDPVDALLVQKSMRDLTDIAFTHVFSGFDLFEYFGLFENQKALDIKSKVFIILLDINMPQQDGYDVLKLIRLNHNLEHLPVVIFTSQQMEENVHMSYEAGANAYVEKPSTIPEMRQFVQAISKFWRAAPCMDNTAIKNIGA